MGIWGSRAFWAKLSKRCLLKKSLRHREVCLIIVKLLFDIYFLFVPFCIFRRFQGSGEVATSLGPKPSFLWEGGSFVFVFLLEDKRKQTVVSLKRDMFACFSVSPIVSACLSSLPLFTHTHTLSLSICYYSTYVFLPCFLCVSFFFIFVSCFFGFLSIITFQRFLLTIPFFFSFMS